MPTDVIEKPLVGKELLKKLKEMPDLSRTEKARACGYVVPVKGKEPRVSTSNFLNAILAAKGIEVDPIENGDGRGRDATYRVSVHQNGQMVIGSTYTKRMGVQPGDEFEIKLGYKHIHLKQISADESEG